MMKPTEYPSFGENFGSRYTPAHFPGRGRVLCTRYDEEPASAGQPGLRARIAHKQKPLPSQEEAPQQKQAVTYFLKDHEREIGKLVRDGVTDVSTQGVFLYVGSIDDTVDGGRRQESSERKMLTGHVVEVGEILQSHIDINAMASLVYKRYEENERGLDEYVGLPFVKGMTDFETKRTMLIVGDLTHHGQAAQGYFFVGEKPYNFNDQIGFGKVVLWNNVGDLEKKGFLGIDYQHGGKKNLGGAKSIAEVKSVLAALKGQGFSGKKMVYLLRTPHMRESAVGEFLRTKLGARSIDDYLSLKKDALQSSGLSEFLLGREAQEDEYARLALMEVRK
ncbi:hypothetical protein HYU13_06325 [Candidatus Woesearchaeota archaeon]|nr:hypothetical protein [Candidatus Woesearchaeota archaeon]